MIGKLASALIFGALALGLGGSMASATSCQAQFTGCMNNRAHLNTTDAQCRRLKEECVDHCLADYAHGTGTAAVPVREARFVTCTGSTPPANCTNDAACASPIYFCLRGSAAIGVCNVKSAAAIGAARRLGRPQ